MAECLCGINATLPINCSALMSSLVLYSTGMLGMVCDGQLVITFWVEHEV